MADIIHSHGEDETVADSTQARFTIWQSGDRIRIEPPVEMLSKDDALALAEQIRAALAPTPALKRRNIRWTPERVAELRRLYNAGTTLTEIGREFGISASCVSAKIKRLGITKRRPDIAARNSARVRAA